jgi:hypothetical protein
VIIQRKVPVGPQSFMYEESNAIGSLGASAAERGRLAAASAAFNAKNEIWRELFGGAHGGGGGGGGGGGVEEEEKVQESVCRFCFSAEGELLSPWCAAAAAVLGFDSYFHRNA